MEIWRLDLPGFDHIHVEIAPPDEFDSPFAHAPRLEKLTHRVRTRIAGPRPRVRISVNGEVTSRLTRVPKGTVSLQRGGADSTTWVEPIPALTGANRLRFDVNVFGEVLNITYLSKLGDEELTPPPGSRGERYRTAIDRSMLKRFAYPAYVR